MHQKRSKSKVKDIEYIIIDGGSSDKTIKIIKKYKAYINIILSEKDDGIYDAFNKGLKLSSGKFIGIVNSDDYLTGNALSIIKKYINKNKFDFIFGSVKSTGEYFMVMNLTKYITVGVFIRVTQLVFL